MKTEQQAMEFVDYIRNQLHHIHKPQDFNLVDYLNDVLQNSEGYQDFLLIKNKETNFVGLYRYSDFEGIYEKSLQ